MLLVKHGPRRRLLRGLVQDVTVGIESLGERDFARGCRRRGFPPWTHQFVRRLPSGQLRYDTVWEDFGVEVELDGLQHRDAAMAGADALKQNVASITGAIVLRIPFFAFRADPEPFLDQVEAALRSRGWAPEPRVQRRRRASVDVAATAAS